MSIKKESWQESLEQVRSFVKKEETVVEEPVEQIVEANDETVNEEIEELLRNEFVEEPLNLDESEAMIQKAFRLKDKKATMGIANLLNMTSVKVLQKMQKDNPKGFERMAKKMGELPAMEEVEIEEPTLSIEKLAERNMLGRLAKSLRLTNEGKNKLFEYFEKGELK
tara:strand:- start:847 stop:1347 length:501 start_codon:yes stop_codon:yes gene_type:complete